MYCKKKTSISELLLQFFFFCVTENNQGFYFKFFIFCVTEKNQGFYSKFFLLLRYWKYSGLLLQIFSFALLKIIRASTSIFFSFALLEIIRVWRIVGVVSHPGRTRARHTILSVSLAIIYFIFLCWNSFPCHHKMCFC